MSESVTIETSGLHPATASCLEALQWLQCRHECHNVLDIGCGNGILSLTAAALWNSKVVAADISAQALEHAKQQCSEHTMHHLVTLLRSDGFNDKLIRQRAPYDLIICNLLAEPIMQWAPQMQSHVAKDGVCVLSGILEWLSPDVETTYKRLGFDTLHTIRQSPWVTCILKIAPAPER